ncbi:NADH:ubiquinone oxidoreductase subunit NDUFA12 [Roseomonas sp. HJA6]|uniref:NADH:ubiquinone oxidoreductase subunit NDUFA12 n=1 Tax=Roseomonas alba TaxID=2846776 RepID=A0ABS7A335_9PROT|nr:NADH-ubiquinone oxidoreductase subunit NDUFA12 family protein [Neoroseomonas alba]MBW6396696.1 NADH:ubiquinone oxidoreductase subunit NDUFA12 [Neoroseomonas alba]
MAMFDALFIRLTSRRVGQDKVGNTYWEARRRKDFYGRPMRRVIYPGANDPTTVPPEWWGWIHHTTEQPLPQDAPKKPWQKEHRPNLTGTPQAWSPAGQAPSGDYEAWTPGR